AYLQLAENIAGYLLNHPRLPKDRVPYWDFDAPINASTPRDVSAAAIMASALWELGDYSKVNRTRFKNFAKNMVQTLYKSYQAPAGTAEGFLLLHSTGHLPANSEIDVPLIYAD